MSVLWEGERWEPRTSREMGLCSIGTGETRIGESRVGFAGTQELRDILTSRYVCLSPTKNQDESPRLVTLHVVYAHKLEVLSIRVDQYLTGGDVHISRSL